MKKFVVPFTRTTFTSKCGGRSHLASSGSFEGLRDMLPTKVNMITRGIIAAEAQCCVSGCGAVESATHLFISCDTFGSLWSLISSWIGSSLVTAQTLPDHFVQFSISAGDTRARRSFMQLIWPACGLFGQKETTDCSEAHQTLYFSCWTRSRLFPIGGLKRQMLL
ncbi:hypothetical protein TSUD_105240 [Trifolium subterraneum]|uniref:Reverse transcriptase zinc-binding domain-containing protein n=1 Tax=Trifolium subterraneum TaxID=3900 RepID=A0A2Z6NGZ3_TRISU|nr:hypothetical protein TSUD_105240 [Trifolium subterraneum]